MYVYVHMTVSVDTDTGVSILCLDVKSFVPTMTM